MRNWLRPRAESRTEQDGSILLQLEMPGIAREDIEIEVDGRVLTVSGERKLPVDQERFLLRERYYGAVRQEYSLGQQVDSEKIDANLEDGILKLRLPIKEAAKPRKIPVLN